MTAYYLWLPFLLTFCFGFAKFPRSVWRNFLENGLVSFCKCTYIVCLFVVHLPLLLLPEQKKDSFTGEEPPRLRSRTCGDHPELPRLPPEIRQVPLLLRLLRVPQHVHGHPLPLHHRRAAVEQVLGLRPGRPALHVEREARGARGPVSHSRSHV